MKLPKIQRPELEIHFVGVKGFFEALQAICKAGMIIKKVHIDYQYKTFLNGNGGFVKRHYYYVIPKYTFKRVSEIGESEVKN